jgi:hypothetical protein
LTVTQSLAALKEAATAHFELLDSVHAYFTYLNESVMGLDEYEVRPSAGSALSWGGFA